MLNMINKNKILITLVILLSFLILNYLISNFKFVKEKVATEFIIITSNMSDGPVKSFLVSHIKNNIHSYFLIPAIKLSYPGKKRTEKARKLVFDIFSSGPFQPKTIDSLIVNIDNEDPLVRYEIINILANTSSPKVLDAVMDRARNDKDITIRAYAIFHLGFIKDARSKQFLLDELNNSNSEIQSNAADALSFLISDKVIILDDELENKLVKYIFNPDNYVHSKCSLIRSLKVSTNRDIINIVTPLLADEDKYIRKTVIELIGQRGSRKDIVKVIPFLSDKDPKLVQEAKWAIKSIKRRHPAKI